MKCPTDGEILAISNRGRIEIDYCPSCRGVWLDRGELDKIIDEMSEPVSRNQDYTRQNDTNIYEDRSHNSGYKKKKRKENFLGDLFDF